MGWKVRKFVKENGKCPFDKWRDGLTAIDQATLDDAVLALEATDIIGPETVKKYLTTDLYEFKIKGDKKQLRPLVERDNAKKVITILCGSVKKGAIPKGDLQTAKNLLVSHLAGEGSVRDYWEN